MTNKTPHDFPVKKSDTEWRDALLRGAHGHGALANGAPAAAGKTDAIR